MKIFEKKTMKRVLYHNKISICTKTRIIMLLFVQVQK